MTAEERKTANVYQKLINARLSFLNQHAKKSGKNIKLEFTYFELEDIVPLATRIFSNRGLLGVPNISREEAVMSIYNVDNPAEEPIVFRLPYTEAPKIISNAGNEVTNDIQALGASITYLRRYLWMVVLDIVEADDVDPNLTDEKPEPKNIPATPQQRAEIKEELTAADEQADELQIKALKEACKKLMELDKDKEEFVQNIAMKTKGMTKITRSACEELVKGINAMIAEYKEEKK